MFAAAHEWTPPPKRRATPDFSDLSSALSVAQDHDTFHLYQQLAHGVPTGAAALAARRYLGAAIAKLDPQACDLPESPQDLIAWMQHSADLASAKYRVYLQERQAGGPRRYFSNRAHALYFLRSVAPTKLVDGSWLYGLLAHAQNPRFSDLVQTYIEELGEGQADKNHVVLYRQLLHRYGLDPVDDLADDLYIQGVLQLGLGFNASEFLPEVIGFNLGYEQLPLHLLITSYELNELGIDPYYFTLHITVDNEATGHARRAVQAVLDCLPRLGGPEATEAFWQRVRHGYQLSNAGVGTSQVIAGFDIDTEVVRIMSHKSAAGHGAHSDYCKVAGRGVNDWLSEASQIPAFLAALTDAGWIKRGQPVQDSRFWHLLQGDRAEMFGVFSAYELQVIHDWIRGEASADGLPYTEMPAPGGRRRATFRATARLADARRAQAAKLASPMASTSPHDELLDPDLQALKAQLAASAADAQATARHLVMAMSPNEHWTPAGLYATRVFLQQPA